MLLLSITGFELRQRLRRPASYLVMLVLAVVAAVLAKLDSFNALVHVNQPYTVTNVLVFITVLGCYAVVAHAIEAVRRDSASHMSDLVRATPAPDWVIVLGRFAAVMMWTALLFAVAALAFEAGCRMPWIDAALIGGFKPAVYVRAYLILVLPTLFALVAVAMLAGTVTRNAFVPFLLMIGSYLLLAAAKIAAAKIATLRVGAYLDPFGLEEAASADALKRARAQSRSPSRRLWQGRHRL